MLDVALACLALLLLWPVMLLIAFVIYTTMGKPVLFRQTRPGYQGRLFQLLKFRTMTVSPSATPVDSAGDAARLTPLGVMLRRSSLDELPQLWNVLKGELSLVGPRPLLTEYLDYYTPEQARRHDAKPGITGLAQVRGRNAISWEEKFTWDLWYVDHWSFWMDVRILWSTVGKIIGGRGVSQPGEATMTKFGAERR